MGGGRAIALVAPYFIAGATACRPRHVFAGIRSWPLRGQALPRRLLPAHPRKRLAGASTAWRGKAATRCATSPGLQEGDLQGPCLLIGIARAKSHLFARLFTELHCFAYLRSDLRKLSSFCIQLIYLCYTNAIFMLHCIHGDRNTVHQRSRSDPGADMSSQYQEVKIVRLNGSILKRVLIGSQWVIIAVAKI